MADVFSLMPVLTPSAITTGLKWGVWGLVHLYNGAIYPSPFYSFIPLFPLESLVDTRAYDMRVIIYRNGIQQSIEANVL